MPSLTQVPQTVSSPAQWGAAGTSDPGCVQSNDGDTTFLETTSQSFSHAHLCGPAIPAAAVSPVNSCVMGVYCRTPATDTGGGNFGVNGGANIANYNNTGSYVLASGNWPTLAVNGIDGVGTRITTASGGTINIRCTYIYRQIDYTLQTGGFVFLLELAGLAALRTVGTLADFAQFSRYVTWRQRVHARHTILTGDEVQQAWRELRAYRHPRFFAMRAA